MKCQSLVIFSFHNQYKTEIFTINKPNIMIKSKHQQYFCCFIVCILISYAFWFSYLQNIVTILITATFRGATLIREKTLIRGRLLFQCGYPKVWCLLEGGTYLGPGAYQRKYGMQNSQGSRGRGGYLFMTCLIYLVSVMIYIFNCEEFIYGTFEDCIGLCNSHYYFSYSRISTR